jgi:succinate-semialdehyde dehydrogenase / glutarate-semialdehyde dehydrogenase
MSFVSRNPANNQVVGSFPSVTSADLQKMLSRAQAAQQDWRWTEFETRAQLLTQLADLMRERKDELAGLITLEMGKLTHEAVSEVEKCALACDYYSVHGGPFLEDEAFYTDAGRSYVAYYPLGTVLAIMPWNFPFWQAFRFAVPAVMGGNAVVLKHASNVPQCALAIEKLFKAAGFPDGVFITALLDAALVAEAITSPRIHAVTLTGSEAVGRQVAATAGAHLKKCVLELGGSDAFIVLADADLEMATTQAVIGRYQNCGQSCIAAKRFIVVPQIADDFIALFKAKVEALKVGDPTREDTQLGPMARQNLVDELHAQVRDSIAAGAKPILGCEPIRGEGAYYNPSILDQVSPATRAWREELFGPVASIIRATSEDNAIAIANDTQFGLGASLWARDFDRAEKLAERVEVGMTFINGIVKSDPRLPFGGVKNSGYGRELSYHGIREFVNAKTVWIKDRAPHLGEERRQEDRRRGDRRT